MAEEADEIDDSEFGLPSNLQALKDEVLSGETWSMKLQLPESTGSFDSDSGSEESPRDRIPLNSISSTISTIRKPLIRAPPTRRDSVYFIIFLIHWIIVFSLVSFSDHSFRSTTQEVLIIVASICGSCFAGLVLVFLFLEDYRSVVLKALEPISVLVLICLAVLLISVEFKHGRVLNWGFIIYLMGSAFIVFGQVRRTRDRMGFLLVLIEITLEVLGKYPVVFLIVMSVVIIYVLFISWWIYYFAAYVKAAMMLRSVIILFLGLNLYWTSQVLRLVVVLVSVGTITHWFSNAYQLEQDDADADDKELASGEHAIATQTLSPLLFDGALLPPYPNKDGGVNSQVIDSHSFDLDKRPEAANGGPHRVALHFLHIAVTTSLGSCCKGALACLPVHLADVLLLASFSWPRAIPCVDNAIALVRSHHEVLFVHVAAYSKSFNTAARDVWQLIDESGLQVVYDDDVCGGVLRATCLAIAGLVAAFVGLTTYSDDEIWGYFVIFTFVVAYLGASIALQMVDSAVTAVYLVYAEHPQSLRANFPIVHHRFERITEFSSYDYSS